MDLIKKSIATCLLLLLCGVSSVFAVPAFPKPIKVTQKDGSQITVLLHGDEFYNYSTTTDGYTLRQKDGIYYYAMLDSSGALTASSMRANDPQKRSASEKSFVKTITTGLQSGLAIVQGQARRESQNIVRAERSEKRQNSMATRAGQVEDASGIVLLVEFQDVEFSESISGSNPQASFNNLMNQEGYSMTGAAGSVRDYFLYNSNGQYNINFDVKGPYKVSNNVAYYGGYSMISGDVNPEAMVREACELAYADGVDFAKYAVDGEVPNLIIIYAGYGEADSGITDTIWQHEGTISPLTLGGVTIRTYACSAEIYYDTNNMTGIGVVCHEFSHVLGIPDFYDSDYSVNGYALGQWVLSVMDAGSYLFDGCVPPAYNSVERWMAGWLTYIDITEGGYYTLNPLYENFAYRVKTYTSNEFYVLEYRDGKLSEWDKFLDEGYPLYNLTGNASGMSVTHYDRSNNRIGGKSAKDLWITNMVNAYADHECMRLVTAVEQSSENFDKRELAQFFFPYNGTNSLTPDSSPALLSWAGTMTGYSIKDIQLNSAGYVTFTVINLNAPLDGFVTLIPSQTSIAVNIDDTIEGQWKATYSAKRSSEEITVTSAKNHFTLTGLNPATEYNVKIENAADETNFIEFTVTTLSTEESAIPRLNIEPTYATTDYVWLDAINLSGTPKTMKWYVDGTETTETLRTFAAGKYEIMCTVTYENGDSESLVRYITVK